MHNVPWTNIASVRNSIAMLPEHSPKLKGVMCLLSSTATHLLRKRNSSTARSHSERLVHFQESTEVGAKNVDIDTTYCSKRRRRTDF